MTSRKELEKAIAKIASFGGYITTDNKEAFSAVLDAAREHLKVLPHSKFIEVWHVEYCVGPADRISMKCEIYDDKEKAASAARMCKADGYSCVNFTGPHQHEVPA